MDAVETNPVPGALRELARRVLAEDVGCGDVTSLATVPETAYATGRFVAWEETCVFGLEAARAMFCEADPILRFVELAREGEVVGPGGVVAEVEGPARSILAAERIALNLLMRLSGVATLTRRYVSAVRGTGARIADTRKTTPGLRTLEKAAVRAGGGTNHRMGLDDGILIKDNHLVLAGGVAEAVRRAKAVAPHLLRIEVEVESEEELHEALRAGADAVLVDNMRPEEVGRAVEIARQESPGPLVEVSGGVDLQTVRSYAEAGPDLISVGALTHSAPAADLSLEVEPC